MRPVKGRAPVLRRLERAGLCAPRRLTVAVARDCNLRCAHCYVDAEPAAGGTEPPLKALRELVDDFVALGGRELCLTGGEPLVRPDWLELLSYASSVRGLERVQLQTNAALLDDSAAAAMASLRCGHLRVQVSLEGASYASHDFIRGAGSFEKTLRGLESLVRRGLGGQVEVAFTEMRHNIAELPEVLGVAEGLGIRRMTSAAVTSHGRAASSDEVSPPEPAQYGELVRRYLSDARFRKRCSEWAEVAALKWWEGRASASCPSCSLVSHLYLGIDGRLYPCPLLHAPEFAVEGRARPLGAMLAEGLQIWERLQRMSESRSAGLSGCLGCPGRAHCGGGCMGRAFLAHGTCLAPEDRCELRKAVYSFRDEDEVARAVGCTRRTRALEPVGGTRVAELPSTSLTPDYRSRPCPST